MKNRIFYSLSSRYAGVSLLLCILVLSSASVGYQIVSDSKKEATSNIDSRDEILVTSRKIRNAIWNSRELLEEFLLEPNTAGLQENIDKEIQIARKYLTKLVENQVGVNSDFLSNLQQSLKTLSKLEEIKNKVIETRLNAPKQYPSIAIARDSMRPSQGVYYSSVELAMQEILEDGINKSNIDVYLAFDKARQLWSRLISNFRMYLANRLGSFSEEVLPQQERDNNLLLDEIYLTINELKEFEGKDEVGFQGSESIERIQSSVAEWHEGYKKVIVIHGSGKWRGDKPILLNELKPLYFEVWSGLQELENHLQSSAQKDINKLTDISNVQLRIILATSIVAVLLILTGYLFLKKSILNPIASLTNALDNERLGEQNEVVSTGNAKETQSLIRAFNSMKKEIRARQDDLRHQAMHDDLTGLPNRNLMREHLKIVIAEAKRELKQPTLLMMDLDGFKQVNDTLGHHTGDKLLIAIGKRLSKSLRETDTIIRLGGDEFAVIISDANEESAKYVSLKIINLVRQPFQIDENLLYVSASIGIAHYPIHGDSGDILTQHADVAMYHAKRNKLGITTYDPSIDENKIQKISLISDLRNAFETDQLELYYQPKKLIKSNIVQGAEALLRWNHPENGFIPPEQIITLAEQSGLINVLFEWVFENAAKQTRLWIDQGIDLNVAVNLSVYDLQHHDIVTSIQRTLEKYHLCPENFTLEVTESAMMVNPDNTINKLHELDQMGIRIAIDDYGTGYSSLSYLKKLPVDELKIDKSFVIQMDQDDNDAIIVRSTIDLAHNLGLKVVAEGVENIHIIELLTELGCDTCQGFHLAKPMPPDQFNAWLSEHEYAITQVTQLKQAK